jgi:hypothetical protein
VRIAPCNEYQATRTQIGRPISNIRSLRHSCDFVDTGLGGLALCLFGGDVPEGRMEPLTIVVSFDGGERVALGSIACWIADLAA